MGRKHARPKRRSQSPCRRHSHPCHTDSQPRAGALRAAAQRRNHHRRDIGRTAEQSRTVDRGKQHSRNSSRRRRRASRRSGDRSHREVHHPRTVRFPCALGRVHGRALRQSRRDVGRLADQRPQGAAREKPGRARCSAVLPPGRPAAASRERERRRHPADGAGLARDRARFRVVCAIQRQECPHLRDRRRRSAQSRISDLRSYRQCARLGPRRHGHRRAHLGIWRSRHVTGAAAGFPGREISDLGNRSHRLAQSRRHDRGCRPRRRLPQSDAALRVGRHEQERTAPGARDVSRAQQSGPLLYSAQRQGWHSRPGTADQELLVALREHALDQPSLGRRPQRIRDRFQERARIYQKVCRGRRQDSRRHGYHRGGTARLEHASGDGDACRGRAHAHAGAESRDVVAGRIAGRQERRSREDQSGLDPRRQLRRSRGRERRSAARHLEHQEDRAGHEEWSMGRARLPPRILHVGPPRQSDRRLLRGADDQRDGAQSRDRGSFAGARGVGRQRVCDDVPDPGRRHLRQDDIPYSEAAGVRSPRELHRARGPRHLQPAGTCAERRHHRQPQRRRARVQPAAGWWHFEHGLSADIAEVRMREPQRDALAPAIHHAVGCGA